MSRPSLTSTMLGIAKVLALRATCRKLAVGCVLTDTDGVIVGTGYNGVPRGHSHCTDLACPGACAPKGADLCEAVHAELNALLCPDAHRAFTCYVTHAPCSRCVKVLLNTHIQKIVFLDGGGAEDLAKSMWTSSGREWREAEIVDY
jgi:dCMP deaminase